MLATCPLLRLIGVVGVYLLEVDHLVHNVEPDSRISPTVGLCCHRSCCVPSRETTPKLSAKPVVRGRDVQRGACQEIPCIRERASDRGPELIPAALRGVACELDLLLGFLRRSLNLLAFPHV